MFDPTHEGETIFSLLSANRGVASVHLPEGSKLNPDQKVLGVFSGHAYQRDDFGWYDPAEYKRFKELVEGSKSSWSYLHVTWHGIVFEKALIVVVEKEVRNGNV